MATLNEMLRDALLRHQIYLTRYSGSVRNRIIELLDATEDALHELIMRRALTASGLNTPKDWQRLKDLQDRIVKLRGAAWDSAADLLAQEMLGLAQQEAAFFLQINAAIMPVVIDFQVPTARQLRGIVNSRPFEGRVLREWAQHMKREDLRRIHSAIQVGMTAGETNQQITRRVLGTQVARGRDGVTQLTRHQVHSITRTAVQHIANNVRKDFIQANADLYTHEQFLATLDNRTTPVCRANDRKVFPIGKGPHPILHYGCRSLRVPVINGAVIGERPAKPTTEKMLLREYASEAGIDPVTSRAKLPRGHKTKFDAFSRKRIREMAGTVPADTSYQQWLKRQSIEFQNDVLGVTKARLFREGNLPLDRFVNRRGDELTLAELARKEKAAFKAAGLNPDDFL